MLPSSPWSQNILNTFASSWKTTHLKMLAVYAEDPDRSNLLIAAARNAATSYEALGLDFDGNTPAQLYDDFAQALTGGGPLATPNHGEYSIALPAADAYFQQHTRLTAEERRKATTYIAAHVEDDVEAAHCWWWWRPSTVTWRPANQSTTRNERGSFSAPTSATSRKSCGG